MRLHVVALRRAVARGRDGFETSSSLAWLSLSRSPAGDFSARRGKSRCALASGHKGRLVHEALVHGALVSGVLIPGVCPRKPTERIAGVQKRREQDHPEDLIAL